MPVVNGTRDPAGPGLGSSRFGIAPAACPWGCVFSAGGWSNAPFCPLHRPPGAEEWQVHGRSGAEREVPPLQLLVPPEPAASHRVNRGTMEDASRFWKAFNRGLDFWNHPDHVEESSEEEEEEDGDRQWLDLGDSIVFPSEDCNLPPHRFSGFESFRWGQELPPTHHRPRALEARMDRLPPPWGPQLTAEEAERNARELLAEEERVKRKAEKKKLKKKKQKDRKKREKLGQEQKSQQEPEASTPGHPEVDCAKEEGSKPGPGASSAKEGARRGGRQEAEEMEAELDLNCTFVSKARQKAGVRLPAPRKEPPAATGSKRPPARVPEKVAEPKPPAASAVEQSLVLAGRGNEAAQRGCYSEAVQAFTAALRLNPVEHRLFGNRSFCYERLQRYEEALADAVEALRLRPGWLKGLFRKGKALRGLQRYAEAADTFAELLRLNGADAEAGTQLAACRALLPQGSLGRIPVSPSPLEAEEPPPSSSGKRASGSCQHTDASGFITVTSSRNQARGQGQPAATSPATLPATHPARDCYPLWVGNITPRITEAVLHRTFGRFGEIRFIRLLPDRRCAFVNFTRKKAAEAAFAAMQDAELEDARLMLQLKHPSHATPSPRQHPVPHGQGGALPGGLP